MRTLVQLTDAPIRVSSAPQTQPLYLAADVGGVDILDFDIYATFEIVSANSLTIDILTAPTIASDDGWATAGSVTVSGGSYAGGNLSLNGGFMRFIRWKVTSLTTTASFLINGVGRSR